jgi:hypothetical protein
MSWKSLISAAFICVLAAMPAMAAPTMTATLLGLDTDGNWQWQVSVTPDASLYTFNNGPDAVGGSVAVEVGIEATGRGLFEGGTVYNATNFLSETTGFAPDGYPAIVGGDQDGRSDLDEDEEADLGIVVDLDNDRLVAFLGSDFFTTAGAKEMMLITTDRPSVAALTTTLETVGAYAQVSPGVVSLTGTQALLAQNGQEFAVNTVYSKSVLPGNANLDGIVNFLDLGIMGSHYELVDTTKRWQDADFTGDGFVNFQDLGVLASNYEDPDSDWTVAGSILLTPASGSGSGAGSASLASSSVPEPSAVFLAVLAGLAAVTFGRKQ